MPLSPAPDATEPPRVRRLPVALRENLPLLVTTALWAGGWAVVSRAADLPRVSNRGTLSHLGELLGYFATDLLPILVLVVPLVHLLRGGRAKDLLGRAFWADLARAYLNPRVLGGFLVVLATLPVFYAAYRDWKTAIPALVPFHLDPWLERADRALHGGTHPWAWLHGTFGRAEVTHLIDGLYVFWFEATLAVVLWMAFSRRRRLRARFFIAYAMVYVGLGHLAATAFSSAGPAYFALVAPGAADPYAPLLAYLHGLAETRSLFAVDIQRTLWAGYTGTYDGPISGISAFPSVHVAVAGLWVFVAFAVHRALGCAFLLLLAVTLVGSVHLGWHYALDGYASLVAVSAIWALSGPLTRIFFRWAGLDAPDAPDAPASGDQPSAIP